MNILLQIPPKQRKKPITTETVWILYSHLSHLHQFTSFTSLWKLNFICFFIVVRLSWWFLWLELLIIVSCNIATYLYAGENASVFTWLFKTLHIPSPLLFFFWMTSSAISYSTCMLWEQETFFVLAFCQRLSCRWGFYHQLICGQVTSYAPCLDS